MSEGFLGFGYREQLATWLVASFLLYTLASQIAWQYRYPGREDVLGRWIDRGRNHPLVPWLEEAVGLIYYLGIPFLVAVSGLLRADLMGISSAEWIQAAEGAVTPTSLVQVWAWGVGLATMMVLAFWVTWQIARLLSRRTNLPPAVRDNASPVGQRLLGLLYDQIHWAFYRSGLILLLNDPYWGIFASLGLALLEAGLNPAHWWSLKSPRLAGPLLMRLGMAWLSTLLFLATRNLWLTIAAHLAFVALISWTTPDRSTYLSP